MRALNFFRECLKIEEQNEILSAKEIGKALKLYEDCFNLCSDIKDHVFDQTILNPFNESKISALLITNRLLLSSQSIRTLTLKGYHYESLVLQRSYVEGLGLSVFLSENLEEAKRWLEGKRIKVSTFKLFQKFSETLYRKLDPEIGSLYQFLCDHVHTNIQAVIHFLDLVNVENLVLEGRKIKKVPIRVSPFDFDKREVAGIPSFPLVLSTVLLEVFSEKIDEKQKKAFLKRFQDLFREFEQIQDTLE